ncbi:MAG TPA: glutathione S-transferase family protein [Polyangiaceae bacterium]|nr:glutathione S-transferase family protein [Polyangiaceae bacterium]
MKLYHHPLSSNARRAFMTALLLESPVEAVVVDLTKGAQRQPDYMKLNPNGKVPTLVDGNTVLWESLAIMIYLCEKARSAQPLSEQLYPSDLAGRTEVNKWLFWTASHWSAAAAQLNFENMLKGRFGLGEPNSYAVGRAELLFAEFARTLDATLGKQAYVAGERLTLADIAIAPTLMYTDSAKLPVEGLSNLQRWFASIRELPAWKATEPNIPGFGGKS